uniref:Putative ovule protein n=1 Tax=Solanum chacoense TaxID=4108 RepID=A0A0V0GFX4_SOLCH
MVCSHLHCHLIARGLRISSFRTPRFLKFSVSLSCCVCLSISAAQLISYIVKKEYEGSQLHLTV